MTNLAIQRGPNGRSAVVDLGKAQPAAGEVVLAPEAVSLCGTDLQMLRGIRDDPSPVIGHEGACRVTAVGAGAAVAVGDRVTVNPTHPADPKFLLGHNVPGLFQQRVLIAASAVSAGLIVPIPRSLDSATATLIEPVAVIDYALACLRRGSRGSARLVVVGDGLIGNLAALRSRDDPSWSSVVLVHTSEAGRAWSSAILPEGVDHVDDVSQAPATDTPSVVLIATHRDRTIPAVEDSLRALGTQATAVHLIGGVPSPALTSMVPGVDFAGVRSANTGGPWPPSSVIREANAGGNVRFTGNRGVTSEALGASARALTGSADSYAALLTHPADIHRGAEIMNEMVSSDSRLVNGVPVIRLVVTMNEEYVVPPTQKEIR